MSKRELKQLGKFLCDLAIVAVLLTVFFWMVIGCGPAKDMTIPKEPTIWIVSEIYEPDHDLFHGMIGYKLIPVNPGTIKANPTWKLDYKGKYYVGQRVDFAPIAVDSKTTTNQKQQ